MHIIAEGIQRAQDQGAKSDKCQKNFYSNNKEQDPTALHSYLEECKSQNRTLFRKEF